MGSLEMGKVYTVRNELVDVKLALMAGISIVLTAQGIQKPVRQQRQILQRIKFSAGTVTACQNF